MNIGQKIYQAQAYLNYWLLAVNEHSLQPPFVYQLYTQTIKADFSEPVFQKIEALRSRLLQSPQRIRLTDLGAGSSMNSGAERPVRQIARYSLSSARFSRLLYRLIRQMEATTMLELGTSLGINTLYLSAAMPEGRVYSLEGCPQTAEMAEGLFRSWPLQNISLQKGDINHTLAVLLEKLDTVDGAYIDANHTYKASMHYFELLLPKLHEQSFLVVDDIHWSRGMQKAWKEMQQHPRVSLSLDLYDAGLVFFRPGLQKAHYVLAY